MRSIPLIDPNASSSGSTTSRSTVCGEPPGYGTLTATTGGVTSGNSSVSSSSRLMDPNTTSATITTVVTTRFRIEKSEIHMRYRPRASGAAANVSLGFAAADDCVRSEEHTSELQSQSNLV